MTENSELTNTHPVVLLSLLRDGEGLFAWISNAEQTSRISLAELPAALHPQRDALLADWQSVRSARDLESAWPAFWRVFWSTQTEKRDQAPLPMPQRVAPAPPPEATAAHPRAFRGTKFKPPKQPAAALDLCAWLGDDRLLDGFFARHDFARLPCLDADGRPILNVAAPTVSQLLARRSDAPALPEAFRRAFLWQLRLRPLADLLAWLQIWRGLGGPQQGPELALPAHLCALAPDAHVWAGLAFNLSPARQIVYLRAVLAHRAYLLPHDALSASQLMALDAEDDERFDIYLNAVFSNLGRQVSAAYTLCGCLLANRITDAYRKENLGSRLHAAKNCLSVSMEDIDRMSSAVGPDRNHWELTAWENCGRLPGFDTVLRDTCWEQLSPAAADHWLAIFQSIIWDDYEDGKIEKRWRAYLSIFPEWHRGLAALSGSWQEKYANMLRSYVSGWEDVDTLRKSVPYLLPLQQRFCRPPFSATADGDSVLSAMAVNLQREGWQQLATTDERTWLIVERACRRDNDAMLISRGMYTLTQCWPAFLMQAFSTAPKRLMRTARLLGCLAYERRRQFLSETSHTVWFATAWADLAPLEACRTLYRLCIEAGMNSPVPRRLRDYFEGRTVLSDSQIERHCRVSIARLPTVLLAALEMTIWRTIDARFNLRERSTAANHAVRLLAGLDDNRKGLRRFLAAYSEDRAHDYIDHPLNRAWFARHPRINAQSWLRNPPREGLEGSSDVHLAIETDPLEILMLGTYVGSCLGLGGLCDYSAVACLLDANKQVIYARDASGRVLARQLLAIDERDRLVCFAVYPVTADKALVRAFDEFGRSLAQSLGIEMYRNQAGESYDIPVILAQHWWDDGVWEEAQPSAMA